MSVVLGSANPGKLRAVREVFGTLYPDLEVRGVNVPSGVRAQPLGAAETRRGAVNRAWGALRSPAGPGQSGATWGVGLEGGVRFTGRTAWLFGVVAVARAGTPGVNVTRTAELRLPPAVARRVLRGEELGPVMDDLLGTTDIKHAGGTVGAFTQGLVTRPQVWAQALALALAPLLAPEVYGRES